MTTNDSREQLNAPSAVRASDLLVRPRTVTLSERVRQTSPVGFLVVAQESIDVDYMVFPEEREARDYAMEQEAKANAPEDSWPIYALWASEWPNDDKLRHSAPAEDSNNTKNV